MFKQFKFKTAAFQVTGFFWFKLAIDNSYYDKYIFQWQVQQQSKQQQQQQRLYQSHHYYNSSINNNNDSSSQQLPDSDSNTSEVAQTIIKEIPVRKDRKAPKYPIVLCHGFSGFDKLIILPSFKQLRKLIVSENNGNGESQDVDTEPEEDILLKHYQDEKHKEQKKNSQAARGGVGVDLLKGLSFEYWYGIQEALVANGTVCLIAKVPPLDSIEVRAKALNKFISEQISKLQKHPILKEKLYHGISKHSADQDENEPVKINLIAHSMGGLDSRYLIAKLEQENYQVVSLTTVLTPHRGSEVADYLVRLTKSLVPGVGDYSIYNNPGGNYNIGDKKKISSEKSTTIVDEKLKDGNNDTEDTNNKEDSQSTSHKMKKLFLPLSIYELTTTHMAQFNQQILNDDKNVRYFSYGARFEPHWYDAYSYTYNIIKQNGGGDNDGLVSVNSAIWGKYMGTIDNADHLDLINWKNKAKKMVLAKVFDKRDTFDPVELYLNIADDLAREGF